MVTKQQVIEKLKAIKDPELDLDIWTLGLIYNINIVTNDVKVRMTFTFPGCPYGPMILDQVKKGVSEIKGVKQVVIDLTFDPIWQPSVELKEMLGL